MVVGKGGKGPKAPLNLKNFSKKGCFLSFVWEKVNFTTFGPPWKNPSDAHAYRCRSGVTKQEFSNTSKLSVFKSVFVTILLHGYESWLMTEKVLYNRHGWDFCGEFTAQHLATEYAAVQSVKI